MMLSVLMQVIRDVAKGNPAERADVIRWLSSPDDVASVVEPLGLDPEVIRLKIASLFRHSPALTVHYAGKLMIEISTNQVREKIDRQIKEIEEAEGLKEKGDQ
jgi:hypothetical protein